MSYPTAKVIAHSIHADTGQEIITWELEYPRIIHSEFMTHRTFSRNAASSRAIPVMTMIDMIRKDPAKPVRFGMNQAGMQDAGDHEKRIWGIFKPTAWWDMAIWASTFFAKRFAKAGYHKQIGNRLMEAGSMMKTIMTATEVDNFFWLRCDEMADPTIEALANAMHKALSVSIPIRLRNGDWHTPYYQKGYWIGYKEGKDIRWNGYKEGKDIYGFTLNEALQISTSCCAQVSFRKNDDTLEKAISVHDKLINGNKVHGSPFEHCATPMKTPNMVRGYQWNEDGVTHMNRDRSFWSGNFRQWIQYRQLVPGNVYTPPEE